MNKKLQLALLILILLIIVVSAYLIFNKLIFRKPNISTQTFKYFVSEVDTTKYCNGLDMDSAGYQKTIIIEKSVSIKETKPTNLQIIRTIINEATTGMCNSVMSQLNITESNGIVYIPPIDAWAGSSIVMCSCKPQIEVNILKIPGITKIVWLTDVNSFEDCVSSGNVIMESYPRQCRYGNKTFVENIGNELEKVDLIRIENPRPNQSISSPLVVKGQARGFWFFEASFPVVLTDWDGRIIAQGIATAKSDWMTNEFVPFEVTLTFVVDKNVYSNKGSLILQKDNPSGLPQNDDALEIPIIYSTSSMPVACTQEAKLCSDGSYVGRTGPNCEFANCP